MGQVAAIILAAGRGERARTRTGVPKQYRQIGAYSVLERSIARFLGHPAVDLVQPVIHPDDEALYRGTIRYADAILPPKSGGSTRQESVLLGLEALQAHGPEKVLIHDAARPFVLTETIDDVLAAIEPGQCALPAHPVTDTLKRVDGNGFVTGTVARDGLACAQTPQGFLYAEILDAHRRLAAEGVVDLSDDAAVAERAGLSVRIVPSPPSNSKITTPEDLAMAELRSGATMPDIRTGNGYDVHALVSGNGVTLCGVKIPFERSLSGHSDADVGLHALTDALLGAIGDGDIGDHFPPSDPQWRGVSSDRFLAHAGRLAAAAGGVVTHADVTLICEAPKIGPHRMAMRKTVAEILAIDIARVSVKATTTERLGFVGRSEGIAALATVTVVFASGGWNSR